MHLLFALSIAVLAGCSLYLILSRHIVRVLLGVTMLSAAINLVIFFAGRIVTNTPAVIRAGESSLPAERPIRCRRRWYSRPSSSASR